MVARATFSFSFTSNITTLSVLESLANSSVCPVNFIPPLLITSLLIGQVTIASNSLERVLSTACLKIEIMKLAQSGSGFPGFTLISQGWFAIQSESFESFSFPT